MQPSDHKGPARSKCFARISEHRRRRSVNAMHVSTSLNHQLQFSYLSKFDTRELKVSRKCIIILDLYVENAVVVY